MDIPADDFFPPMKTALKQKWVQALRSGKYEQGSGRLREDDCFCCIGVLADILDPAGWNDDWWNGQDCTLTDDGCDTAELDAQAHDHLTEMNDNGMPFPKIADWIEENL